MGKILKTKLEKGLFIGAVLIMIISGVFAYANSQLGKDWVNRDYEDYKSTPESYTVVQVPIKSFKTLNGTNCNSLTLLDLYRVCKVDVTFAGGQTRSFYIPRSADDEIGDMVSVAYLKHWDTRYNEIMKSSDVEEGDILETARAESVTDGMYARLFTLLAITSAVFAGVVIFICYKKKDAYNL
ncbi:MAG: hypothetical protein IKO47_11180 [Ruminococcus sp.]|nr:hypothetical protein [Ruminococcus sp.]